MDLDEYGGEAGEAKDLNWRDDPSTSLSDHIIKVGSDKAEEVMDPATYNVHKCQLALGQRSCDYFRRLFVNKDNAVFSDYKHGISEIKLPASAADAFASFLDFVYGLPFALNTTSAIPLLHLANYFGSRALYKAVVEFIQQDLVSGTSPIYMAEAEKYRLEKISAAASKLCIENFATIDADKLVGLTPTLFMRIVQSPQLSCASLPLSNHVAAFCQAQPVVDESAAIILLQQALAHGCSATEDDSLRKRCIRVLASNWRAWLQTDETVAPAAKRQRTSEVGSSIQGAHFQMPVEIKLELAMVALLNGEEATAAANLQAEQHAKRADEEKKCADAAKKRADEEKKRADRAERADHRAAGTSFRVPRLRRSKSRSRARARVRELDI